LFLLTQAESETAFKYLEPLKPFIARQVNSPDRFFKSVVIGVEMIKKLYVGNLPTNISQDEIRSLFAQAGEVGEIKLAKDRQTQIPKGIALVMMTTEAGQLEAIKRFNGYSMDEKLLNVRVARLRPNRLGNGRAEKNAGSHSANR
jgi:RNA recognition motif-containing protein